MRIIIDADACPVAVKEIVFKASARLTLSVIMVANQIMRIPKSKLIILDIVDAGPDEADHRIVEIVEPGDLVISADVPLADRVIKKGAVVLDPRGDLLNDENIGSRLATRNLMNDLRAAGLQTGGPGAFTNRDRQEFAGSLDRYLTRALKDRG
jgi:uncharacterized protein YaiI (UPF0178 family)